MEGQYFDWYDLFVNEIVGNPILFVFIALALVMYISAIARIPNQITIALGTLLLLILGTIMLPSIILPIILVVVGGFIGWTVYSRIISR